MSTADLNSVTNDLLSQYDEKFNELYNTRVKIDSSIMNKEELIIKENDEIQLKDNRITILQYTIGLIILFGVLLILNALGKIDFKKMIILTIILIIIYLIVIYFSVYYKLTLYNAGKILRNTKVEMDKYITTVVEENNPYQCPTDCPANNPTEPVPAIQGYRQPVLNIDPQLNVWKYGDLPENLYTTPENPGSTYYSNYDTTAPNYRSTDAEKKNNEPHPAFDTTHPLSTYYKCSWLGENNNTGSIGGDDNQTTNMYSTVPCSYRPNFTEIGRYICKSDPNKAGAGADPLSVCDDITSH